MSEPLEIRELRLHQLEADSITSAMAAASDAWYELVVSVRNAGGRSIFVMSEVRRTAYDDGGRSLILEFSERNVPVSPHRRRRVSANVVEVAAGSDATLAYRLSSPLVFNYTPEGAPTAPRFVRIPGDVRAIRCSVAFDESPPRQNTNLASHLPLEDVRRWGRVVEGTLEVGGRER